MDIRLFGEWATNMSPYILAVVEKHFVAVMVASETVHWFAAKTDIQKMQR